MRDKALFVFIEVRYRKGKTYGTAIESINFKKRNKVRRTAGYYLQKNGLEDSYYRFDAVGVEPGLTDSSPLITWVQDAF